MATTVVTLASNWIERFKPENRQALCAQEVVAEMIGVGKLTAITVTFSDGSMARVKFSHQGKCFVSADELAYTQRPRKSFQK